jgi:hypothetical protein
MYALVSNIHDRPPTTRTTKQMTLILDVKRMSNCTTVDVKRMSDGSTVVLQYLVVGYNTTTNDSNHQTNDIGFRREEDE